MKEKLFKRWLSVALAMLMIITAVPFAGGTFEERAEDEFTEDSYTYRVNDGEAIITYCDRDISGDVVIPSELGGYPVVEIGYAAFSNCTEIQTVTMPDTITEMGVEAFSCCYSLKEVHLSENLNAISRYAFSDCSQLKSFTIPDFIESIEYGAFFDCTGLTSITIPDSVTDICGYAFSGCSELKTVTIGKGVTRIDTGAFEDCVNLTKVFWNAEKVSDYGFDEFEYDGNIDIHVFYNAGTAGDGFDVIFGDSVTVIPDKAFLGCPSDELNPRVKSVTFGKRVLKIGASAFEACCFLESITIPETVAEIGSNAFKDCYNLRKINWNAIECFANFENEDVFSSVGYISGGVDVVFGDDVVIIPKNLFSVSDSNCMPKIKSVTFGNNVEYIGEFAFGKTNTIEKIKVADDNLNYCVKENCLINIYEKQLVLGCNSSIIPTDGSVTSIADNAFYGCEELNNISVPDSVISIGKDAFYGTSWYDAQPDGDVYAGKVYYKYKGGIADRSTIKIKDGTKGIAKSALEGYGTGIENVIVPDGVESIGENAFKNTYWYDSLPDGDVYAGRVYYKYKGEMPDDCSVTIREGTKSISDSAFLNREKLKEVTITNSVTSIGSETFHGCTGLTSVTIPDSVTSIGLGAFEGCTGLTSVTIPDSVTSIGLGAFARCIGLTSVTIPDSVTSIGLGAFGGCKSLTNIVIPNGVTKIGAMAFAYCNSLTDILIPDSVTSIGLGAFGDCTGLTSVTIPDSVTSIGYGAFAECTGLTSVTIPNSVTSIGFGAFWGCTGLKSITIPKSVKVIDDYAFGYSDFDTKLQNFTIYGYAGTAAETYANENGFTFITLDDEHTHSFSAWTVTREATCTAEGVETRTCSGCGATETRKTEKKAHELNHVENKSTCKIKGVSYDICADCGETFNYAVLPLTSHTFGEWKVTKEATSFEFGERVRTCSVCGFEESEKIEKLPVSEVKDEKTGISVVCPDGSFDGKVEIEVTETFDGTSYNILNNEKGNFKNRLFDISTLIDGKKAQPNGTVMVKIPLPDGYSPENTIVYYITNDGKLEKIESEVKDGYIIFETTHFSYYAIVDESSTVNPSQNCSCACHKKGIVKFFFKIKLFFQKLFKKNKLCLCGVNHY